jgi:Ca2+-binding EF-hand superfamily protein
MIDVHGRGFITQHDLTEGLHNSLLFNEFSNDDVYLFFRRNDFSGRGSLNLQSFTNGILPFSPEYA